MKKILLVAFIAVQSVVVFAQVRTNEIEIEFREDTKVENPLKIQSNLINDIGVMELDGIANVDENNFVRGSILFSRDGDLSWNTSTNLWTLGAGVNNDFAAIIHDYEGNLRFFGGPPVTGGFSLPNLDFRNTYERMYILGNGNIGMADSTIFIQANNQYVGIRNANPLAHLHVNGNARITGTTATLRFEDTNDNHGNWQVSSGGGRFRVYQASDDWGTLTNRLVIRGSSGFIGVNYASPRAQLHVEGSSGIRLTENTESEDAYMIIKPSINVSSLNPGTGGSTSGAQITNRHLGHLVFDINADDEHDAFAIRTDANLDGVVDKVSMVVKPSGDIGIGTTSPLFQLQVGIGRPTRPDKADQEADIYSTGGITIEGDKFLTLDGGHKAHANLTYEKGSDVQHAQGRFKLQGFYGFRFVTQHTREAMMIKGDNGYVGIGTTSPQAKLHVNGTIKAPVTDWSDFVFYDDYELPSLEEVESHIEENGHLQDIPSEEDVMKNGVNLTQMDAKLLQKIEELTLYLIEQNKELKDLKARLQIAEKALEDVNK